MKKKTITKLVMCLLLCFSVSTFAQLNTPRGSQQATVVQRIGVSDVSITYSRPSVKEREIWGKVVPYGMNNLGFGTSTAAPWRAGANENTTITFSHDAKVEGKPIKAGTYGLHLEVKADGTATLILSKDADAWGSYFYNENNDALRATINTVSVPHHELLTFEFNNVQANSATASLVWEKKAFPFEVSFDVTEIVLQDFRKTSKGQAGFQRQNWEQAASYALNNGGNLDEALTWIDKAIAGQFFSQKTFNNLAIKAQILNKQGKSDEFAAIMSEAASMANANQLNALGYQMLGIKDYDKALMYFKKAVSLDPENPNVYDSLGEAYKMMGNKKEAIKNFKKSLSLNPPANVKANSEKHLRELGAL
ncbi:DUF2911 domain-containing protein [Psychroserpens algicola]|uniref:DUF2911 domain-containing protein n=1 Tax=Psychroserpens algicola TaxID=1719034 RepID=A0ABT0H5R1_9FLAO|nr:DUF2911 domain-containing protein [Psychroserpens algicola]MCK8479713.1 DUF2911 domain-containing protein [Psychroserpens algicola]